MEREEEKGRGFSWQIVEELDHDKAGRTTDDGTVNNLEPQTPWIAYEILTFTNE